MLLPANGLKALFVEDFQVERFENLASVAGLRMTMTLFPILLLVIGVIFFHKKYKLTDERLKEIQEASI